MTAEAKTVLVSGDVILDHHIYKGVRPTPDSPLRLGTRVCDRKGGAWLLYRMLDELGKPQTRPNETAGGDADSPPATPPRAAFKVLFGLDEGSFDALPDHLHGYAIWEASPAADGSKGRVWRMTELLGYGEPPAGSQRYISRPASANDQPANLLVLDDAALGYRFGDSKSIWPAALQDGAATAVDWIVLKMCSPLAQGDLWRALVAQSELRDKLVTVVSINDICRQEVRIVRGLSWERTAQDLVRELECNPAISDLLQCRHLIVTFWSEGAVHMERVSAEQRRYRLLFDSGHLEGQWGRNILGKSFGFLSALTAAVVRELVIANGTPNVERGIQAGLSAMRLLAEAGHGPVEADEPGLPLSLLAREICRPRFHYAAATVPRESMDTAEHSGGTGPWTLIAAAQSRAQRGCEPLYGIAHGVALAGTQALASIPYARFGNLFTVDRDEIESLRTVERLILNYIQSDKGKQPLSLAVFGQPGSGKSFSVKQIAGSRSDKPSILEFNLSQFRGPEELIGAFHQVRDAVLKGETPFVFWDEFDSREYQWLQYLLAPMQDGQFQEGQLTHPIGKCIFIFAGGTSFDFAHFGPRPNDEEAWNKFRACKGPDFVSRLSGYLNVLGPNPRAVFDEAKGQWVDDPTDICFPVRRALFLRVLLKHFGNQLLEIDRGVLSAFLETSRLKHGARSMEKLLTLATQQAGGPTIGRSDLPSAALMDLYVDSAQFIGIINRNLPVQASAEELAPAVHKFYTELAIEEFRREHHRDPEDSELKHPGDYHELSAEFKDSNRAAGSRIPLVLEMAGLYIARDTGGSGTAAEVLEVIERNLELLAATEHGQWMRFMQLNGWRYAKLHDDAAKLHNLLIPYDQLSESDKDKDRNQVREYPSILAGGGYKIVTWSELIPRQTGT